jgi:hypothetical protein
MHIPPSYTHIVNPKLKYTYLLLDEEGELIVKSPKLSQKEIETLLLKKAVWIRKAKENFLRKKGKPICFHTEPSLYFLGTLYPIVLEKQHLKKTSFLLTPHQATLLYHNYNEKLFLKHIDAFYKEETSHLVSKLIEKWGSIIGVQATQVSFRKTKRQWGSCSYKNHLSFNTMLTKLPLHLIEYVVVHELIHIIHKHHQKAFWAAVSHYLPNYQELIVELKTYTP